MIGPAKFCAVTLCLLSFATGARAEARSEPLTPAQQFEQIRAWEGRWQVEETPALKIVFESTARGSAMVERWETQSGLHSMTLYHMDGDVLMATHYCPQGNQPRLESRGTSQGEIRFEFRDVTDLSAGESHTHALWFTQEADGTLKRSEVYRGEGGLQPASHYTLSKLSADIGALQSPPPPSSGPTAR